MVGRTAALLALFAGLVVYYETNEHWWQAGLWWDVAFIACVLMPAVFGLVLVGVPWWSSRRLFPAGIACVVLIVLGIFYRKTPSDSPASAAALALVAGGALGNLTDRIMSAQGVVDFIDIGIGNARFYTFNVADAAITCGAVLLALLSMKANPATKTASVPAGS